MTALPMTLFPVFLKGLPYSTAPAIIVEYLAISHYLEIQGKYIDWNNIFAPLASFLSVCKIILDHVQQDVNVIILAYPAKKKCYYSSIRTNGGCNMLSPLWPSYMKIVRLFNLHSIIILFCQKNCSSSLTRLLASGGLHCYQHLVLPIFGQLTFGKIKSCQHLTTVYKIDNESWYATNL